MIDRVKICKKIKLDKRKFSNKFKLENYVKSQQIDYDTGEILKGEYEVDQYRYSHGGITIKYSNNTNKLCFDGKLIDILHSKDTNKNLVYNLDDVYQDRDIIIDKINKKIYEIIGTEVDIREFIVSYIEVTFNIYNVDAARYIYIFNKTFKQKNDTRYKNYIVEEGLSLESSFYVKTKSSYEKNIKESYSINFYNKLDQLNNLEKNEKYNRIITEQDKELAKNTLRLEVQLNYKELKKTSKIFGSYLDINFCFKVIKDKYTRFISSNPTSKFYSYKKATEIIKDSNLLTLREKNNVLRYLRNKYSFNKKIDNKKEKEYIKLLNKLGIQGSLIDTKYNIDCLESPIILLEEKIEKIKLIDSK